jgi:hypothetical protein
VARAVGVQLLERGAQLGGLDAELVRQRLRDLLAAVSVLAVQLLERGGHPLRRHAELRGQVRGQLGVVLLRPGAVRAQILERSLELVARHAEPVGEVGDAGEPGPAMMARLAGGGASERRG